MEAHRTWTRPLVGWLASFGIIGSVALIMVLTSYPLARGTITGEVSTGRPPNCTYCRNIVIPTVALPNGVAVTVSWSEASGNAVDFFVTDSSRTIICSWIASHGTCDFVSSGGHYDFSIRPPYPPTADSYQVDYTVEWYSPPL